mgnify:CR=1 FL=1|tara:strand:+ start:334 stop:882 length:549 start_codon:yes stop_codon:yes gene_type:complete
MNKMKEKTNSSKVVFKGKILDVRKDGVILPNGKSEIREWINHPGAACCIPIMPDGKIVLIKQYRYAVQKVMIELPAGKLDIGEEPEVCARRELEEEIGYKTNKLKFLTIIHPAIGFTNEKMWIYIAEDLEKTRQNLDNDEFLTLIPTDLEDALGMVWSGKITDVKTMIGLLWADKMLKNKVT